MKQPKWDIGERFERIARWPLKGKPSEVFPLLCPVREYEWLPGWSCTMVHAASGVAEKDAVFQTTEVHGRKAVWTTITYEPDRFIEYLVVMGRDAVMRLSITLESADDGSVMVTWRMLFTVMTRLARLFLAKSFSEQAFAKMMSDRQAELGHFLETGSMIGR